MLERISDFIAPDFSRALGVASVRHDVVAVQISDPAEDELPDAGWIRLMDPETGEMLDVNTGSARVRNEYQRLRAHWLAGMYQTFKNKPKVEAPKPSARSQQLAASVSPKGSGGIQAAEPNTEEDAFNAEATRLSDRKKS